MRWNICKNNIDQITATKNRLNSANSGFRKYFCRQYVWCWKLSVYLNINSTATEMIRTTITPVEFERLTWLSFENIASDINDVTVNLTEGDKVVIAVCGETLQVLSLSDYNGVIN